MESGEKSDKKAIFKEKLIERQNEAKVVRKIVAIISISIFTIAAVVIISGYFYISSALKPVDPNSKEEIVVKVPIGSGVTSISKILEESGIIKDAHVFKYYVKFKNESSGFMAGDYVLNPSMTLDQIISSLKTGKVMQEAAVKLTIPEGTQLKEIAEIIAGNTNNTATDVMEKLNDHEFIDSLMKQYPDLLSEEIYDASVKYPLEGYLFPATYSFSEENPSIEEMTTAMLDKTQSVIENYKIQLEEKKMTVHELLTMASLIEEEATEQVDRDQISSVFYNRLDAAMPLQTDPTVLYAKEKHQEKVYYKDLEIDDPYNTYKYPGLTPGPIANAGVSSIEAALSPAETKYMYFLASPDGQVYFSTTLEEHNEKKAEYITGR
ncbi:endolytic transglycosylase MltG [Niallia sp. Krafla_26]|uniref:endolytic transglycosylase MltG n=1 Tax=Niallia sp. Krafla_26 TaxID=3064703 RepID=UPI003D16B175